MNTFNLVFLTNLDNNSGEIFLSKHKATSGIIAIKREAKKFDKTLYQKINGNCLVDAIKSYNDFLKPSETGRLLIGVHMIRYES